MQAELQMNEVQYSASKKVKVKLVREVACA
jgi:hypothetical protein